MSINRNRTAENNKVYKYEKHKYSSEELLTEYKCDCNFCLGVRDEDWDKYVIEYMKEKPKFRIKSLTIINRERV
jgi:hypothetical protein